MPAPYISRFNPHGVIGTPSQLMPGHLPTEPMSLGSPTTSPNAANPHGSTMGAQYLPGFLMGEAMPAAQSNPYSPPHTYPTSRPMQLSSASPPCIGTPKHNQPYSSSFGQPQDRLYKRITSPPTQSLWSMNQPDVISRANPVTESWDLAGSVSGDMRHSTPSNPLSAAIHGAGANPFLSPYVGGGPKTPGHTPAGIRPLSGVVSPMPKGNQSCMLTPDHLVDVLNTPKSSNQERSTENCWVTVFGYPASRASYILSQFAQFGTIEKHVITNDGNWMHIKYQNKLQARCAMNRNGRVFGDNIMVGVTPCSDEDVLNDRITTGLQPNDAAGDHENSLLHFQSPAQRRPVGTVNGTPLRELTDYPRTGSRNPNFLSQSFASPPERPTGGGGNCGVARHSSMRSLTGDGRPGHLGRTASVRRTQESGLLSKALGYMFGWS